MVTAHTADATVATSATDMGLPLSLTTGQRSLPKLDPQWHAAPPPGPAMPEFLHDRRTILKCDSALFG